MAEKKSWRDYTSGGTEAKEDKSDKKTSSWRDYVNPTAVVGKSVTEQLNNWLTNHNSYISEYQKRSEGRKYTYEDAYVGDSADWLKSETERRNALNNEANSILSYLDQYGGHLDPKILEEVRMTINRAKDTQYQIHTIATQDNEWWNSFNDEELVKKYGSAEGAYNYYQRADGYNKKYTGMTSDELSNILDGMEDGEEKDWLTSYASSVDYEEKKNLDIDAYAKEIEDFADFGDEALTINVWYNDYMAGREPADAHKLEVYNRFMNEYGGDFNAIKTAYSQMNARMNVAKRIQEGAKLAGVADPTSEFYDPEFAQYSQYVDGGNTPLLPFYSDIAYDFANGKGSVADIAGGKQFAMVSSFDLPRLDAISRMNENERAIYNYYHSKHGHEAAEEYLDSIIEVLNYRTGEDYFAPMKGNPVLETAFGFVAGLDQFGSGIANLFNGDDYIPTSAVQYTSGMVRDDLKDTGFKLPDWMGGASLGQAAYDSVTTIANMAPSILASTVVGTVNPAAGAVVGNVLMGASAAGNAYQEALNLGYDKGQARAYSTLVGASEVGLQYLMGGIGKLGGKLSGKTATSLASKFDNAYARLAVKYGTNMLSEGAEEYLQEILTPVFKNLALKTDEEVSLITEDAIYSFLLGAVTSGVMEGPGTTAQAVQMLPFLKSNRDAVKKYGTYGEDGAVPALIESGLESPADSESYRLAQIAERKTNRGKKLSGYEIRQLVSENQKQITAEILAETKTTAEKRLTELGESQNVSKIAELVAKRATGQEMTRAEISTLARSQYGAQVAKEMRESEQPKSGTKSFDVAYKSLEERVSKDKKFSVSESGQAEVKGETVSLKKAEVKEFVTDKTGKITDMVIEVDGKTVKASEIDYADGDQSYLFSAVTKIENITPADATAIIRDYDPSSGLSVSEYLNGVDEGFTYGYHGYSEADMKAGYFTTKLSDVQAQSAYVLGQNAKKSSNTNKSESIKRMRTAVDAEVEKLIAEGKTVSKGKMTITYNAGSGNVVDFDKANVNMTTKQKAAPALAKVMHEMGLGTNFELFSSYLSKTMKDEDGNRVRVFLNDMGEEEVAYSGVYRMKDGTIRIDLNAYNGRGLTLDAMSHELTHFIQQWSGEKYEILADFLVKTYEKTDMSMHDRVLREQARLERIRKEEVSYSEAYDEVVANAMSKMLADGKVMERLQELKAQDMNLAEKLWEGLKKLLTKFFRIYEKEAALFHDAADLMELKAEFEQMQKMWAEAFLEASDNFQMNLMAIEIGVEPVAIEDFSRYSYSSLAEAAGFVAVQNEDGTRSFTRDGKKVSEVTVEDIDNSPIGAFINFSVEMRDITADDAKRQKQMFADICTMACKTNDFAMTMQFVGSAVFTGMKANADKQYGTTYDFPSICTKTQAVIDAMSAKMKSLGRGLTTDEIVNLYDDVFASGNPVPCPECYVFSRWIGIGGLLDNIKKYQDYYGDMDVKDVADAYLKMKAEVSKFAKEQGISFGKAKGAMTSKFTKEFNNLTEKIEKQENQGEKVKPSDRKRLAELEPMMNTVKAITWLENVYFADSSLKKVNPNFRVPNEVLFDLNNGEAFATQYKEAWAFRTTQGAGYGKAITPYAEARLGEGVLVTNNTTNAIKGRAQGSLDNYFLRQMGKLDKQSRDALKRARMKQKIQAFIGGQRFQSTSDARYENASDYLLAALEMQAMAGMVQAYTKVDGAIPAFSAWGFSSNQSLMPLNGGLDADGNVQDTPVGGMNPEVAFENRNKHESAGTITIGVNDNHIRAMFQQWVRDFIIPYHASGGKADVVDDFRRIQEGKERRNKEKKEETLHSTDYSRTQSDKILSDEVLRWQGKTDAQIQRIHEVRAARIAILTGGKPNMTVVRSNKFLSALYDKLNGGEWDGVKLAKSKVESQIFPNEFWDQTVSYDESAKITKDYLEYCEDLGFLHRFSGLVPSNGMLVPVRGYDQNGNRVQLTDLAYKYDENGNKTDEVEEFFWKVLTDRRMYDNNRKYLPQKVVTLNDTTTETVTGFAKHNQGRQYDKAKAEALAKKIVNGERYSSQETDRIAAVASDLVSHMVNIVNTKHGWYAKDVFKYVEEHPELGFIELIYAKDKNAKKYLEAILNRIDDVKVLEKLSWYMGEAYGDKDRTWNPYDGATYPYRGAVRTFRNSIKKRINAIMTEKVGGTNLGIKNGEVSLAEVKDLYGKLNSNEEMKQFAEKVFATSEKLGVNIRFVNQTLSKHQVAGDNLGDMVEYKTSYFNDTAVTDQRKANTILHELIHACTVYVMEANKTMGDVSWNKSENYNKISNAATRLNRIYSQIAYDPDFKGQYGITNAKEMVAELANENFVGLMKKKNLWDQIVDWICDLFGIRRGTSAYDNARLCLDYILDNPEVSEYKAFAAQQRSNARYNGMDVFGQTRFSSQETDLDGFHKRASNKELAEMDDTALYIKNTDKANYIGMIFNGAKTEETRSRRTLDAFIGKDFYVTDGKYVYGSIVLGEPHKYTEAEFHQKKNQLKHRVPVGDKYDIKPGGTKWAYPIESYKKFDKPKKLSDSTEYKNSFQARQVMYSSQETDIDAAGKQDMSGATEWNNTSDYFGGKISKGQAKYFADSVVRIGGKLVPVYHGTGTDINLFVRGYSDRHSKEDQGFFWAAFDKEYAEDYADGVVKKGYLNITKILDIGNIDGYTNYNRKAEELAQAINVTKEEIDARMEEKGYDYFYQLTGSKWFMDKVVENGYDGVLAYESGLKTFGFIDSNQFKNADNTTPTSDPDLRYSGHETDNISNRDLLANAFEGIAKSSPEYEMIQEYKGRIKILNEYEEKLDKLNAEIRKMLFDKDTPRDAKKLKELQDEAKKVAENINRNDKKLLSLEASEPLRKIIEREKDVVKSELKRDIREVKAALRNQKSETSLMEKEFIRIVKAYEKLDAKSTAKSNKDTEAITDLKAALKEETKKHRDDQKTWETEFNRLMREYESAGRSIDRLEKKIESQKQAAKQSAKNKKDRAEQTEYRHKIRKAIRDLDKILNRGNKKQNVKEDMKGFVSKALELADYLFTDHVSNDDLIRNGIDADLVEASGKAQLVKETEDILTKLYDEADSLTDEEFTRLDDKRKANEAKLKDLLTAQRNRRLDVPVYNLFNDLVTEYASLKNSNQDAVKAAYSEDVERLLRTFLGDENSDRAKALKNMRVADMTTEELWKLHNAYTMVLTTVRDANKFHVQGMNQTIEQVVGRIAGDFSSRKIPEKKLAIAAQKLANKIGWDYEKLYYALDRIGSEAFTELIMNIADSENTVMQDIMEAIAFRDKIVEKYGFNNWAVNKEIDREFMDNSGKKFKLTLGQMMSLYAYSRREGAWDHIEYGGFVFGEAALTNPKPADSYKLSKEQCEAITSLLTKEQKGYVEDMQKFLSETMGEKGNEVSMLLYGIKMFGEKNYFPIHVAGQFKAQAQESQAKQAAGFGSMSNAGFTHAQNPNAKAPFVLEGFNEVWSDHVNEMSRYHGTVPALEDLRRVMNRSTYSDSVAESQSIKQLMENSFGKEAVEYFDNLYREANSGAITDKLQKNSKKLLSLFRKNSVAYSLSVLIQQPASMVRAYALIDKKYFGFKGFGAITSGVAKAVSSKWNSAYANAYNEMMKYAPGVTMAKEIGGFDTATGGSIRSYLLDTKKSLKQKWNTGTALEKGKAVLDVVDDNAIANLPNVADKIAWIEIWNACKRETVATHKDLAPNSDAFMQAVGERFTEVIRATQVYDSIFAKSPMLKSKNLAVQYLVSFMNEPNTVANMVESAVRNATRGNWRQGVRTGAVVIHAIIFTNVLKSIIYALRDDDEDETYIEKYIESVTGGMMDDLNAFNYIPLLRDVVSLAQGYDVERADMAIVSDALDAFVKVIKNGFTDKSDMTEEELIEFDKKVTESTWKLVDSVAAFFGIPVKNVRREIMAVIDHAKIASANAGMTTATSAWDKVIESIPFISTKQTKNDKLYNAIVNGDKEYLERLKSTYKDDAAYQSAVRKALRENDSRIHAAAQARYDGNTEEYKRIFKEIKNEGKFSFDEIMDAVNSEENAIKNKLEPDKVTSSYAASDFVEAVIMGNNGTAASAKDEIIATHVANGKTQAEAEKAFVASVKTSTHDAYSSGLLDDAGAKNMLVEYADMDEEEAVSKVSYWAFCEDNPKYDYFSEANVEDYREFAEPADISVDVYAQFINGTKGLSNIKDEWGDVEVSKREQVLEVIDSLPLTWQQKDALYLAAGYSEDKIWDVPW